MQERQGPSPKNHPDVMQPTQTQLSPEYHLITSTSCCRAPYCLELLLSSFAQSPFLSQGHWVPYHALVSPQPLSRSEQRHT
jgi:hypothetical protein